MKQPSYVYGADPRPLIGKTIGDFFDDVAHLHAGRDALIVRHQSIRWTYQELAAKSDQLARGLIAHGFVKGDRIGIWAQNCSEWVLMQLGTAKAGVILVNINPAYRAFELEYALKLVSCKGLVMAPSFKTSNYIDILMQVAPELSHATPLRLKSARLPELSHVFRLGEEKTPGMANFSDLIGAGGEAEADLLSALRLTLQFDDPINIQFTSGTTGSPKGATLTHHNILNNGFFIGEAMKLTEIDRLCIPVPLYHCFGMVLGNLACMTHGSTMVYPDAGFDAVRVLEAVSEEKCTGLHGVPTMFIAVLDHPDFVRYDLSSLRTGIMAGSPCPIEVMKRVVDKMHMNEVTIAYGMTETSPVSFQSSASDPVERRVSTVGRIHPHIEVKVVDAEGRIVERGQKGELLTRGYSVMLGYWGDEVRTAESIDAARWMHTGDLATIDDEGFCNIVGRSKDMVIRGGENIYPREVEEFLYRHPKIQDVQCVGVPDSRFGEELCACIVIRPGETLMEEDIRTFCQGQIAHYKVPRYVRFVEGFPMTVTGKVQKYLLREAATRDLGLTESVTA
jgi:fatty-acyl-CoA synthase